MSPNFHTIFSNIPQNSSKRSENRKTSYWLKKLFDQQEQKTIDNKKIIIDSKLEKQSLSREAENKISPEQKGIDEYTKNIARKKESDMQLIKDMVRKSNRCIISVSSLFPWDLFPNTIRVEESRVTFIFRQFITSQSHSLDIDDISNIFIELGLFFATLQIVSRTYIQNEIKISFLRKKDAIEVRKIVEGLRTFKQKNIDTSNYEIEELREKLKELYTNSIG